MAYYGYGSSKFMKLYITTNVKNMDVRPRKGCGMGCEDNSTFSQL